MHLKLRVWPRLGIGIPRAMCASFHRRRNWKSWAQGGGVTPPPPIGVEPPLTSGRGGSSFPRGNQTADVKQSLYSTTPPSTDPSHNPSEVELSPPVELESMSNSTTRLSQLRSTSIPFGPSLVHITPGSLIGSMAPPARKSSPRRCR